MPFSADHHRLSLWRIWVSCPCGENALSSWHTQVVLSCNKLALIEEFLCYQSVNGGSHFWLFALLVLIYLCFGTILFAFCLYFVCFLRKFLVFQNFLIFWYLIFLTIWWFLSFFLKLEKFDDFCLFPWSWKNLMIFIFFHEVGKIWWFLSFFHEVRIIWWLLTFFMKLEKFDDFFLFSWRWKKFDDFCLFAWSWKNLMIFVFFHVVGRISCFLFFFFKLEKFDDYCLFSWSY